MVDGGWCYQDPVCLFVLLYVMLSVRASEGDWRCTAGCSKPPYLYCCCFQVMTVKKRYEVGLEKLQTTESSVQGMQSELIELQPQLAVAAKETEAAMEVISRESAEADKV